MMQLRKPLYHVSIADWLNLRILVGLIVLLTSLNCFAEEEILSLDGARIIGNQELPNVLYLIPWKPPKVYSLDQADDTLSSSPKLNMLDRGSFKRLVNYHETFKSKTINTNSKVH